MNPTCRRRPAFATASRAACASARFNASGFSHRISLPARAASATALRMKFVRSGDQDRLDLLVLQHRFQAAVRALDFEFRRDLPRTFCRNVRDGDKASLRDIAAEDSPRGACPSLRRRPRRFPAFAFAVPQLFDSRKSACAEGRRQKPWLTRAPAATPNLSQLRANISGWPRCSARAESASRRTSRPARPPTSPNIHSSPERGRMQENRCCPGR